MTTKLSLEEYREMAKRPVKPKRPLKYRNEKVVVNGIKFDSKKEARRHQELLLLKKAGAIRKLQHQRKFEITVGGMTVCSYIADFAYIDRKKGLVVEDVKSPATRKDATYRLKKKLMKAVHGIDIEEI